MIKEHPFKPIYNESSKILILGSMPSVRSVEQGFYYMHPQNRFWKILSNIYHEDAYSLDVNQKIKFILDHHLALFDVIQYCQVEASSDATIKSAVVQDLTTIMKTASIQKIILNGKKAYELFSKNYPQYLDIAYCLPSTSPANAAYSLENLTELWRECIV